MKKKSISSKDFDQKFEAGEDLTEYLDLDQAIRPGLLQKRVSVDFPVWMVKHLDSIAKKLGVTRQSVIKVFISDKLKEEGL
jgi:CopG antitoxin of type II toxin-antitoxin system